MLLIVSLFSVDEDCSDCKNVFRYHIEWFYKRSTAECNFTMLILTRRFVDNSIVYCFLKGKGHMLSGIVLRIYQLLKPIRFLLYPVGLEGRS